MDELKSFVASLEKFINANDKAKSPNKGLNFLKQARNYKIVSIIANLGICCATLGYVVPKIMFNYRKKNAGTKEFHVEKQIREKLEESFSPNKINS